MAILDLNTELLKKEELNQLIDREFKFLTPPSVAKELTVDEFFSLYEGIFDLIPKEGNNNSQRYILEKTAEYLGVDLNQEDNTQALIDEITNLKSELLNINKIASNINV